MRFGGRLDWWQLWRWHIATQVTESRAKLREYKADAGAEKDRLAAARQFAIDAARLAAATHCRNVVVLDVTGVSPVTDFFVIATGTSPRQMRSVCDEIEEMGGPRGHRALSKSGYEGDHWLLVDFVDAVVHLFNEEARLYYDLDNLWGDAKKVSWT